MFKRSWFTRIVNRPPDNLRWVRGYDLAVSTRESADFTASFRCAFDKKTGDLYIADGFRKRIEFPEQKRFITEKLRTERNTEHGIEQALHAQAFVQELRRQPGLITRPIRLVRPAHDKFTRALSWANLAEEGKVVLVRGTDHHHHRLTQHKPHQRHRPQPRIPPAELDRHLPRRDLHLPQLHPRRPTRRRLGRRRNARETKISCLWVLTGL